ncbi:MAG TPA: DUF2058 domain-containing protein [Nevskiaceae bacterium]|nr:DUF2058 domain-containing protein [Nevskiaceae bacterium]
MGLSLKDQLLQAGLLTEKKSKEASKEQHKQRKERAANPSKPDPRVIQALKAAEEKAARDRELNRKKQEQADNTARNAAIRQLVDAHKIARVEGEDLYNFVDGKRIRRLAMTKDMREKLVAGTLAIVKSHGRYEIVKPDIAEKVRERDPRAVIARSNGAAPAPDENDPYKDYVVPDDLMW